MSNQESSEFGYAAGGGMTPPVSPLEKDEIIEPPQTRWPKVLGIIGLIYACAGLVCQVGLGVMTFFMEALMQMGGMSVDTPAIIKTTAVVQVVVTSLIGLLLLVGAVYLLQRRRLGVRLMQTWAVLRLLMVVVGLVLMLYTMPAQVAFQRSIAEAQAEQVRQAGRPNLVQPTPTDEQLATRVVINTAISTVIVSIFPVFVAIWFSRHRIKDEVSTWTS